MDKQPPFPDAQPILALPWPPLSRHWDSAIENVKLQVKLQKLEEELERTKEKLDVRSAVAWMGMSSLHWRHTIQGHTITIIDQVAALRRALRPNGKKERIFDKLAKIERLAKEIQKKPISSPSSLDEGVESVAVNAFCQERLEQLQKHSKYQSIECQVVLTSDNCVTVRIDSHWLRHAYDILLDNAVEALSQAPIKRITITTGLDDGWVMIEISDTGGGIPTEVCDKVLREPISGRGKGLGIGLLLARTIVEQYGGEIQLGSTSRRSGTTMIIRLPQER